MARVLASKARTRRQRARSRGARGQSVGDDRQLALGRAGIDPAAALAAISSLGSAAAFSVWIP
jgi:hypothetical protein